MAEERAGKGCTSGSLAAVALISSVLCGNFFRNALRLNPKRRQIIGNRLKFNDSRILRAQKMEAAQNQFTVQNSRALRKGLEERKMKQAYFTFRAKIEPVPEKGGAYVRFPYDIRKEFGKGRVKAEITFDGEPYSGSIVNMGVRNEDGTVCYILGVRKDIRAKIGKQPGDNVDVTVRVAEP